MTAMPSTPELFHVGIVVPDLDAGCARFTELLGIEWGPVLEHAVEVRDGEGTNFTITNRIRYSTAAPHLELIQEVPGTPWVCNEHSNLHHIGYFSDSLVADSGHLSAAMCPLELMDDNGASPPAKFVYHRDPLGVRLEIVNADVRPMLEEHAFRAPKD